MTQLNGIIIGILLTAAGYWLLKSLREMDQKSWIMSTIAWSLLLYGIQSIIFSFTGDPFTGILKSLM